MQRFRCCSTVRRPFRARRGTLALAAGLLALAACGDQLLQPPSPVAAPADASFTTVFVNDALTLPVDASFTITMNTSCGASGNVVGITSPVAATLSSNACTVPNGTTFSFPGPFAAGSQIVFTFTSGWIHPREAIQVSGQYPTWTIGFEDSTQDSDFNDIVLTVTAAPNQPPTASAGGPYAVDVGQSVALQGAGSDPDAGQSLTYQWDFGDGAVSGPLPSGVVTHDYAPGRYTAVLTVSDGLASATAQAEVVVGHEVVIDVTGEVSGTLQPVSGVTVTATNTGTGQPHAELTDANGVVRVFLPYGDYLFHARRLSTGDEAQLQVWPLGGGTGPIAPGSGTPGFLGVLYLNGTSVVLNPANYQLSTASPIGLQGGPAVPISLQFQQGTLVNCNLLGQSGNAQVFAVVPFGDESGLPPVYDPNGQIPDDLPRGIGYGATTDCSLPGAPVGTQVIESEPVQNASGETVIYRGSFRVETGQTQVSVSAGPQPERARTEYLIDANADGRRGQELGLVTYGWGIEGTGPARDVSDVFSVSAEFTGLGEYTLHVRYQDGGKSQSVRVPVRCGAAGCETGKITPRPLAERVLGVDAVVEGEFGSITWKIRLSEVAKGQTLEFRVEAGDQGRSDVVPDHDFQSATRPDAVCNCNSFNVIGE